MVICGLPIRFYGSQPMAEMAQLMDGYEGQACTCAPHLTIPDVMCLWHAAGCPARYAHLSTKGYDTLSNTQLILHIPRGALVTAAQLTIHPGEVAHCKLAITEEELLSDGFSYKQLLWSAQASFGDLAPRCRLEITSMRVEHRDAGFEGEPPIIIYHFRAVEVECGCE